MILIKVLDSWKGVERKDRSLFSDDFFYDSGSKMVDSEVFLGTEPNFEPITVSVIFSSIKDDSETIIFEHTDPITLLKYRTCWVGIIERGVVKRLIETSNSILNFTVSCPTI